MLVQLQSKTDFPNYYLRNLKKNVLTTLTQFPNPFESIRNVEKTLIKYKRKDGVDLSGTLYLPAGYDKTKKEKLPLLIWAYPTEYKDKNSAGQTALNPNEFTFPYYGSFVYWVTKGYVVLDNAAFPDHRGRENRTQRQLYQSVGLPMQQLQSMQWIRWDISTAKKLQLAVIPMAHS